VPTPGELARLLDLQDQDLTIDRLGYRRAHLAERADLAGAEASHERLATEIAGLAGTLTGVRARESGLEDEVAATTARITSLERRSDPSTSYRDQQAIAEEVASLSQRQRDLEDQVLVLMEEREALEEALEPLNASSAELEREKMALRDSLAEREAALDVELEAARARRQQIAAEVAPSLLGIYERLRSRLEGIGAARVSDGSCGGCHLKLPASEVARLRHLEGDALIFCDQCGRILVP